MMLLSTCSAMQDTRSLLTDPCQDSSNGFQGRPTPHVAIQKQRPAFDTLQTLDYVNSCKTRLYTQQQILNHDSQQMITSVTSRGIFQRSCSDNSNTALDEKCGTSFKASNGLMFQRLEKPVVQKSTSESCLRTRRSGQYKNDYASSLHIFHQDSLSSDGNLVNRNSIPTSGNYSVKVKPAMCPYSSTDSSGKLGHSSYDHQIMVTSETSAIRQELFQRQLNCVTTSGHLTENISAAKLVSPNFSNIILNTPGPIFDQFGVLIGNTNPSNDMAGHDKSEECQKINISGFNDVFLDVKTANANNVHSKAVRSSSYPLKLPPKSFNDVSNNTRRQSVQSYDTSLSRHIHKNGNIIHSDRDFCFVPISNVSVMIPRASNNQQYLQRPLSYDPRARESIQMVLKSASCGEIESEYVTLDQRYELPKYSRLNRVVEAADLVTVQTSKGMPFAPYLNGSAGSVQARHISMTNNNKIIKPRPFSTAAKLSTASSGMQTFSNDPLSYSSKHNSGWKNGTGTLSSTNDEPRPINAVIERTGSVSCTKTSANSYGNNGRLDYNSRAADINKNVKCKTTGSQIVNGSTLKRCKSLPDLQDTNNEVTELNSNFSDDEDGDDFGFLSYPISFSSSCPSAAMNKAKSPSPGTRIFPKRWRSKSKAAPAVSTSLAMWTPGLPGSCSWSSVSGRKVQLRPVSILHLCEPERLVLQKIALSKLQSMDIGCPVSIPNENSDQRRAKKSLSLKRRSKSVTSPSLDTMVKEGTASGLVFGIPLSKCLMNDRELEKRRRAYSAACAGSPSSMKMRTDSSENLQVPRSPRKSSSSSQGSLDIGSGKHELFPSHKRAASTDSLPESECSRNTSSSLIDALSLPASNPSSRLNSLAMDGSQQANQSEAQVPYIVKACFRHIETYGLQTLGIFRVGSSKKRVKQLREEFDSGRDVQLTEEHNPHDVGALLKEYFRDLPDPLLTRELYLPFLFAERIKGDNKKHLALSLLISMLPVANRDTLWALLQFLATVSQHATDTTDEKGETVAGNKMDAHNLATLFGPNIIHRTKIDKSSDKEMLSESAERVEQSKEIIEVIKDMIDNHHDLFEISGSLRDEVLRLLVESNQEVADRILRNIANQNQIETDPESMCSVFEDSANSPMLYHSMNSDADLLAYAQRQTTASHRPLRITKSADDSLDSPVLKSRVALLSESQAFSPASKDNHMATPFNSIPSVHRFNVSDSHSSPVLNRVPVLRIYPESTIPDSGRSMVGSQEYPCSEGFNKNLNIPRPLYFRESSSSSISSDLSSLNGHGWSENGFSGQWALPTPPTSRSASPKPLFQSTSSSSTLIASPVSSLINHPQVQDSGYDYKPPYGSAEWERDRWKHWEKIAAQKKNIDTEQETLV